LEQVMSSDPTHDRPIRRRRRATIVSLGLLMFLLAAAGYGRVPKSWLPTEKNNRAVCNKTLRAIGFSIHWYAGDHHNQMPPDLETLMVSMDVPPDILLCRSSNDQRPTGATTQAVWQSFRQPGHCSYSLASLLPATYDGVTASHVLAYERSTANHGDGAHVLFGDGRVNLVPKPEFERILSELKAGHNPPSTP
jgi:prepilin-type processing-associated H-X9-DG protein